MSHSAKMFSVRSLRLMMRPYVAAATRGLRTTTAVGGSKDVKIDATKDYYAILGVMPDATATEIREAFYDSVKACHPDVNPAPSAKREFEYAQEAFAVLKNPITRKEYDLKADVERTLEQKAEDQETHWMARREVRPGKIWSEKLAKDLLRASALRAVKRRESAAEAAKRSEYIFSLRAKFKQYRYT